MIKTFKSFIKENKYFFIVVILYLLIQYVFYFSQGSIVLGGEGNYWLNYRIYLENGGYYTWLNYATGIQAASINTFLMYPLILSFMQNDAIRSFFIIATIYVMPFTVMYFLLKNIDGSKISHVIAISLFFVINPFSINFLYSLNPWGIHTLFIYPLYFLILLMFYKSDFLIFYVFGIVSLLFAYTFTNPPQMVLILFMLPVFLAVVQLMQINKIAFFDLIKKTIILYASFLMFHIWWLVQWVLILPDAQKLYTQKFARSWLESVSKDVSLIMKDLFSLSWSIPRNADQHFLAFYYNNQYIKLASFIPFFVILYWLTLKRFTHNKVIKAICIILFLMTLLLKAANPPFPQIMFFCFDHVPLCYLFKTAPEKFGVTFVFFISLLLFYVLNDIQIKWLKWLFYGYIIIALFPFVSGQYIPPYKTDDKDYITRKYVDLDEFKDFRNAIDEKKMDFRLLSYPNGGNYQVKMQLHENMFYTGHDPILMNMRHNYIADHMELFNIKPLYETLDEPVHERLMYLYSVRYLVVNKRLRSWFGNISNKKINELENALNKKYKKVAKFGEIDLYETPEILPHLFIPKNILTEHGTLNDLTEVLSTNLAVVRPAIYFDGDNTNPLPKTSTYFQTPIVEYKKINAAKYRVVIHGISKTMPLIFSEAYHRMWKAYVIKTEEMTIQEFNNKTRTYKIYHGNEDDQADLLTLMKYFNTSWISAAGPNFISKENEGTIQNNNISNGTMYESSFLRSIPDTKHLKVNGFANSWTIDPVELCKANTCRKNPDGSYDIELLLEFMPQKIFYWTFSFTILLVISATTFLVLRYKKNNKLTKN